jgi:hypothetical protein
VIRYDSKSLEQQPPRGVPWSRWAPQYGPPRFVARRKGRTGATEGG